MLAFRIFFVTLPKISKQDCSKMKKLIWALCTLVAFMGCHSDNEVETKKGRAVMVYMAADNNLGSGGYDKADLREMMAGSKDLAPYNKLYAFCDFNRSSTPPFIVEFVNGDTIRRVTFDASAQSSDPSVLHQSISWMVANAGNVLDYGLVLWGHSTGWEFRQSNAASRAYGADYDTNGYTWWMNIPSMAQALNGLPHLRFIFADCCVFQCVETAYELRHATDYIIGSPAEIPNDGAPYDMVVPALFAHGDRFYESIVDNYFQQKSGGYDLPLSVIKTSELEQLAAVTHATMQKFMPTEGYVQADTLVYYFDRNMYDMNDFIRSHAEEDVYQTWKTYFFDKAVVYKTYSDRWMTDGGTPHVNFRDFQMTEERYGGMSMFLRVNPTTPFLRSLNNDINKMEWYEAAHLSDFGW